jgi:DNA-binding response OmpR family regulator
MMLQGGHHGVEADFRGEGRIDNGFPVAPRERLAVLLVHHDEGFLGDARRVLDALDYPHHATASPLDALARLHRGGGEGVVVAPMYHPEMNGLDLSRELRAGFEPAPALILADDRSSYEHAVAALRAGVDDLVALPLGAADLARALRAVARRQEDRRAALLAMPAAPAIPPSETVEEDAPLLDRIGKLIALRAYRTELFGDTICPEATWDMLLDLARARLRGETLAASSVCLATPKSLATGLRILRAMEESGLVRRRQDPGDKRRDLVELSDTTFALMQAYAARVARTFAELSGEPR